MGTPYEILVGVGTLWIAPASTAAPALTATPGSPWRSLGETDGGVKIRKTQNIERFSSDQRTGPIKAVRTEEGLEVETNLNESTLENLADVMDSTVTTTAAGSGTIGKKTVKLYKGAEVAEFAILFRASSPYGNYPGQFYVPRGTMDDDIEMEYTKDDKTLIPVKFIALEKTDAGTAADRFGNVEYQHAAALP